MQSNSITHEGIETVAECPSLNDDLFSFPPRTYRAYGLAVSSEIRFDHVPDSDFSGDTDVTIRRGVFSGRCSVPPATLRIEASPGRLLIRGARSATILVTGGDTIMVEPLPNGNHGATRQLILGWALGALLHQRGVLPLHGSALCDGGDCFVFCARSGVGKSTLAASFLNRGFSYLDDNMSVVAFRGGTPHVTPGIPELRLWEDALPGLAFEHRIAGAIMPDSPKFSIIARRNFRNEEARLRKIFVMKRTRDSVLSFVSLTGGAKFRVLMEQVFCSGFIADSSCRAGLFRIVQELAARVAVVEIRLPEPLPSPGFLCETIMEGEMT